MFFPEKTWWEGEERVSVWQGAPSWYLFVSGHVAALLRLWAGNESPAGPIILACLTMRVLSKSLARGRKAWIALVKDMLNTHPGFSSSDYTPNILRLVTYLV
jgi:hypothetical protein